MFKIPRIEELNNESDVEQKFIYPMLTSDLPLGMGLPSFYIQTKRNIRKLTIGKGTDRKLYFPDYLIVVAGIPLAVIEAKGPAESITEAFREARLYAQEVNGQFSSERNPLQIVVAVNSSELHVGRWDQAEPILKMTVSESTLTSESYGELQKYLSVNSIQKAYEEYVRNEHTGSSFKPRRLLGGNSIQNEEISTNSFGTTIAADFAKIFNPVTQDDRMFIAKNGYIASRRRERYVDPIDQVIRASRPPSEVHTTNIDDSENPKEIIRRFGNLKPLEHQVLLLVGSVGSGKSTFVDYLFAVALPRDVIESTVWVRINMNPAPMSAEEIYDWLRHEIVNGCRLAHPEIDFDDLDTIRNIFSVEVNQFNKGVGKLFQSNPSTFDVKLGEHLQALLADLRATAKAYTRYFTSERGKLLVIVLDNCDKRTRDEQLLMFQAAEWVQREFRGLVILPLREETFDTHRDRPPLDTAMKDLVFRIEPPLFQNILVRRVQLALNESGKSLSKSLSYDLSNGFRVEYAATDMSYYLTSIIKSIFEHDRYIRRLIVGLSGRNMRKALEIFLEFCTSGHIPEDEIFKIRQAQGHYVLPLHLVTRVLLRMNRRYYDNDYSYLKNILAANWQDKKPSYFSRLMILRWLYLRISEFGPSREKGYFPIGQLKGALAPLGLELKVIEREVEALLSAQCLISEDLRTDNISDENLIRISPSGIVHLDMLANIDYLGAVAEDTYFESRSVADAIASRIGDPVKHYNRTTSLLNAQDLLKYLLQYRKDHLSFSQHLLEESKFDELSDLSAAQAAVKAGENAAMSGPWADASNRYLVDSQVEGIVINTVHYGAFVELEPGLTGLLHKSRYPNQIGSSWNPYAGDKVIVRIVSIDPIQHKITLDFVDLVLTE